MDNQLCQLHLSTPTELDFFCFVLSFSISFDLFLKCYSVTLNCFLVFVPTPHRCDTVLHTIVSVHKATPAPLFTFYMCFASNFRLSFFQMNFKSFAWIYNNPNSLGYHSTAFTFVYLFCENCFFFQIAIFSSPNHSLPSNSDLICCIAVFHEVSMSFS